MTSTPEIGLGLMCKPPRPGVSKTRLAKSIGSSAAARLSEAFLRDTAAAVLHASSLTPLRHAAFFRPDDAADELSAILGKAWPIEHADEGELGATMHAIFAKLMAASPQGAILMGADVPLIAPHVIANAACKLRRGTDRDVVLAPSADGGYCLIGVRSLDVAALLLAKMRWSVPDVLDETLRRARYGGVCVALLDHQRDIDDEADLWWLRNALAICPERASHTRSVLATLPALSPPQSHATS